MRRIQPVFSSSPFRPRVQHAKKAHERTAQVRPLTETIVKEEYDLVHELHEGVTTTVGSGRGSIKKV